MPVRRRDADAAGRERRPADVPAAGAPCDPGRAPHRPRHPGPAEARHQDPAAIVKGRPAPVPVGHPGPAELGQRPVAARVVGREVVADDGGRRDPDTAVGAVVDPDRRRARARSGTACTPADRNRRRSCRRWPPPRRCPAANRSATDRRRSRMDQSSSFRTRRAAGAGTAPASAAAVAARMRRALPVRRAVARSLRPGCPQPGRARGRGPAAPRPMRIATRQPASSYLRSFVPAAASSAPHRFRAHRLKPGGAAARPPVPAGQFRLAPWVRCAEMPRGSCRLGPPCRVPR